MKWIQYILVAIVVDIIWTLFRKWRNYRKSGGIFGMIARNATATYAIVCRVRPDLDQDAARCLALYLNSRNARKHLPESELFGIVSAHSGHIWDVLCLDYVRLYMTLVNRTDMTSLPMAAEMALSATVSQQIKKAIADTETDTRADAGIKFFLDGEEAKSLCSRYTKHKLQRLFSLAD